MFTKHYLHHPSRNPAFQRWLEQRYWPLAGREEKTAADLMAEAEAEELELPDDITAESSVEDVEEAIETARKAKGDPDPDPDPGNGDAVTKQLQEQVTKLTTELAAAQHAARKAKADAREARQKAATEGGDWERLANERQAELEELKEENETLRTGKAESDEALDTFQRTVRVTSIATRLGFRDPLDAMAHLRDRPEDTADDKAAERALRRLSEQKDYLVDERKASGRAMGGGGNGALFTKEQLENMSPDEINANWDKVSASQTALAQGR